MKYTVHYMLKEKEKAVLRSILKEEKRTFKTFKDATNFIRSLKQNDRVVGKPVMEI